MRKPPPGARRRFRPPPPGPGADRSAENLLKPHLLPALPSTKLGAPPRRVVRPAHPRAGAATAGEPPELRRRKQAAAKVTPATGEVAAGIRAALQKTQRMLLGAQRKLQRNASALRTVVGPRD